ncbi:hypothetical protein [Herbiconiux sp. YIM B11900]|uniref:hypothetical protein n=1 Tax=Herbiconiux sp. YIM B11900 TaxID=3404131 RepID=UPI003F8470FF
MGQNRRYPGHAIDREIEDAVTRPQPVSLTAAEVDAERHPIVTPAKPVPVEAWVRFHEATVRPRCEAIAWNDHAVQVRWTMRNGQTVSAWVWRSAVGTPPD